ncbi:MAG TPA: hypothetical protein VKB19_15810, partial [Pedobacter sp.]|nr:hypothetical protein [Pedobacter sp.]
MKRILVLIIVLLIAIVTMAYLYFSGLQTGKKNDDALLYTATSNASIIFSFQNDKSIVDILAGQSLIAELVGKEKSASLQSLNKYLLSKETIGRLAGKENVYISLLPGENKTIEFLYSTKISVENGSALLINAMKSQGIRLATTGKLTSITLPDSSVFFLAIRENLILLSSSVNTVLKALSAATDKSNPFAEFITSNSKLEKSSLAEVYINFNNLPKLLTVIMPGKLNGNLSVLNNQNAFASLVYNYSTDKILFSGTTNLNGNNSYFQLYSSFRAQKISINNILPQNTASYTIYTIENYVAWSSKLKVWLDQQRQLRKKTAILKNINSKYHLDLEQVFPKYFKSQLITFQLSTSESLGAIALSNGEKFEQQLLDVSSTSGDEIKAFKESDLMYCYFGEPFKKF